MSKVIHYDYLIIDYVCETEGINENKKITNRGDLL